MKTRLCLAVQRLYALPMKVHTCTHLNQLYSQVGCLSILYIVVCICGEGNGTPLQYSCLENPMDRGAWQAVAHEVTKSWTRLNDFTFTFHFHALEKEIATHSSVLAWRIPGTGEPGGLPSMGSDMTEVTQLSLAQLSVYMYYI